MESTGKYWIPIYNLLEDIIRITIANPKWVKAVKEAVKFLIAQGLIKPSYIAFPIK